MILTTYEPGSGPDPSGLTVWWRTPGAEVVESRADDGTRSCSLMLRGDGGLAVLMWPQDGASTLFVRDPGWNFGDQERGLEVNLAVGDGAPAPVSADGYQGWIRSPLDRTLADTLSTVGAIRVAFPGLAVDPLTVSVAPDRMPKVRQGFERCRTAMARAG